MAMTEQQLDAMIKKQESFIGGTERLEKSLAALDRRTKTLSSSFNTTLVPVNKIQTSMVKLSDATSKIDTKKMQTELKSVTGILDDGLPYIQKTTDAVFDVSDRFTSFFDLLSGFSENISLSKIFEVFKDAAGDISGSLNTLQEDSGNFITGFMDILGAVSSVTDALGIFGGSAGPVIGLINTLVKGVDWLNKYDESLSELAKERFREDHFGNLTLSMERVHDIASRIINEDVFGKVARSAGELEKVDEIRLGVQGKLNDLHRTEWDLRMNLDVTTDTKEVHIQQTQDYIDQALDLINQRHYSATSDLEMYLNVYDNPEAFDALNETYDKYRGEITRLGNNLKDVVKYAWKDGTFDISWLDNIQRIQGQIQEELNKIENYEFSAELDAITLSTLGMNWDSESYNAAFDEINTQLDTRITEARGNFSKTVASLQSLKQKDEEAYNNAYQKAYVEYLDGISNDTKRALDSHLTMFNNTFSQEMETLNSGLENTFSNSMNEFQTGFTKDSFQNVMKDIQEDLSFAVEDSGMKEELDRMVQKLAPDEEKLKSQLAQFEKAGTEIPESVRKGLMDINRLKALNGDTDAIMTMMGSQLSESNARQLKAYVREGGLIPEEFANGIKLGQPALYEELMGMNMQIENSIETDQKNLNEWMEMTPEEIDKLRGMTSEQLGEYNSTVKTSLQSGWSQGLNIRPVLAGTVQVLENSPLWTTVPIQCASQIPLAIAGQLEGNNPLSGWMETTLSPTMTAENWQLLADPALMGMQGRFDQFSTGYNPMSAWVSGTLSPVMTTENWATLANPAVQGVQGQFDGFAFGYNPMSSWIGNMAPMLSYDTWNGIAMSGRSGIQGAFSVFQTGSYNPFSPWISAQMGGAFSYQTWNSAGRVGLSGVDDVMRSHRFPTLTGPTIQMRVQAVGNAALVGMLLGANALRSVNMSVNPVMCATGGIFEEAQIIQVGEDGREAVVPLERHTQWIDKLAGQLQERKADFSGKDSQEILAAMMAPAVTALSNKLERVVQAVQQLDTTVELDGEKISRSTTKYINNRTRREGRSPILV